jgi:iron(III) transport system substrate-binding protein
MDDGTLFGPTYAALLKGAPHPNAAKLLLEWELSPAGQKAIAANNTYSAVKGAPAPQGFPKKDDIKSMNIIPLSDVITTDAAQIAADKKSFGK